MLGLLVSTAAGIPFLASYLIAAVLASLLLEGLSALAERLLGQPALGLGRKHRSPQWLVGPQGTVPLRSLHCYEHLVGLVDRSAVVVEHLVDAVGCLIPKRLSPGRLLMV